MLGDDLFIHGNVFVVLSDVHLKSPISLSYLFSLQFSSCLINPSNWGTLAWSEGPGAYVPEKLWEDDMVIKGGSVSCIYHHVKDICKEEPTHERKYKKDWLKFHEKVFTWDLKFHKRSLQTLRHGHAFANAMYLAKW